MKKPPMPASSTPSPEGEPARSAADAVYVVPKHGNGRLRAWPKGQCGNPSGTSGRYGEIVRMCREMAPAVFQVLIQIALDPNEDSRARIVAAQEIAGRAFGRIKAEVKDGAETPPMIDASRLTLNPAVGVHPERRIRGEHNLW